MTNEQVTALVKSPCSLAFHLPVGISADDGNEPVKMSVTHNDAPNESFEVTKDEANDSNLAVQKVFEEIDQMDSGTYVITVDVGRQQYIHKLSVSIGT